MSEDKITKCFNILTGVSLIVLYLLLGYFSYIHFNDCPYCGGGI